MIKKLKISDFTTVITGGTPSTGKKEFWDKGDIPWLNSGELNNDRIFSSKNYITELGLSSSSARMMPADSVLIALTGTTTGVTSILKIEACANQSVTGILPSDKHNTEYLYYYISSIRSTILKDAYGGAQKHISQGYVKDLEIPLPPLSTQKAIAEKLDKADALRKKDKELLAQYDELAQAIFFDMFGDPVKNEKGWKEERVGNLCGIGSSRRIFQDEYTESGIPFYRTKEIVNLSNGHNIKTELYISKERYEQIKRNNQMPSTGDILISAVGTIGIMWIVDNREFYFKDGNLVWLRNISINNTYLQYSLSLKLAQFKYMMAEGAAYSALTIEKLNNFEIFNPPISVQNQFAEKIKNIEAQKSIVKQQAQQSEDLFQALLQESFNFN